MENDIITDLDSLLEQERDLLKSGRFSDLEALIAQKENLLREIGHNPQIRTGDLAKIRGKISENKQLLSASISGFKRASATLTSFKQVRNCLSYYGQDGSKINIPTRSGEQLSRKS